MDEEREELEALQMLVDWAFATIYYAYVMSADAGTGGPELHDAISAQSQVEVLKINSLAQSHHDDEDDSTVRVLIRTTLRRAGEILNSGEKVP